MPFNNLFNRANNEPVFTALGAISRSEYESGLNGPCAQLLRLAESTNENLIELIRLNEIKQYVHNTDSRLEVMLMDSMKNGYQHALNGVPIADILIPNLVTWAIQLYGARVCLAPSENIIFTIRLRPN
jgi:hypothetical protein